MRWIRADLHLHTPASEDYAEPDVTYLDILQEAERRELEIIAFTDHNTVHGYEQFQRELEFLKTLESAQRLTPEEQARLDEYRRLLARITVLPGFEFTATFGFHILGIFSPQTPLRYLDHLLLSLNIPAETLESGSSEVGASSDVLTAYRLINDAGGICIAAHANTSHGVAMRGIDFEGLGGQTRIAYTQDRHLHALEVTDLDRGGGRRSTARFFDGTKPEYPRRMRCIQGSDAHAINAIRDRSGRVTTLGVGERATEVLLPERTFEALHEMFQSNDFSRSRAYAPNHQPEDFIQTAREDGPSVVQSFHESMEHKGGRLYQVIADVCAFANTNGGTIYVGLSANKKRPPAGIANVQESINILQNEINNLITPSLRVEIDSHETQGKTILRVQVPFGEERPYAVENYKIYVRDESETTQAIRDEIVNLARQGMVFNETRQNRGEGQAVSPGDRRGVLRRLARRWVAVQ
ncbi:PHP domain-containing protein [bacterium]|nr:PHP domain-containing protein [bacterium]